MDVSESREICKDSAMWKSVASAYPPGVSAWVTELLLCQMAHEERKAILSCVLRIALTCWNIGNFNGAMEIVAGLK
ncbi:1-phosphatidylinositol 4,5-bisphosphate phosphodiesterase epsilon-1 [Eumeta japonica]|uniref:1-phosphatidylinositol 4,5-bisphosphate phosphodiesterase epsilon-1 n=1 Tax=Eumeta variegata TaxID=151549 RepID=A0A4C1ZUB4_EUMVA|nr:1-phosphatidylinositol 4,5-bisphosphate phosphodiesterase epsilon-1 [Eumeta japonica]